MRRRLPVVSLLIAGLLSGVSAAAQSTPSPNLAGIAHVALRVHDLAASVAFYEKLGFVKAFELSRDGKVYEAFIKINDRQFIELYPVDAKNSQVGFLHLCFEGNDLQSVHDFYVAERLKPTDVKKAGAGNMLFTMPGPMTPTGPQNLEYTRYMPGSLHSKDFGLHLGAERVATKLIQVTVATDDPAAAKALYTGRLGFGVDSADKSAMDLPGAASESVQIAPDKPLGLKARIVLEADLPQAAARLRDRSVAFEQAGMGTAITIRDPDGNELLLGSSSMMALNY